MKDITVIDVALADLVEHGATAAPPEVLQALEAKGHVTLSAAGVPTLTATGRARAERLSKYPDLRRGWSGAGGESGMTTDGGCTLHMDGGPVTIEN